MPQTVLHRKPSSIASFDVLVRKVNETFSAGNQRIKKEMAQTCWRAGQYIHEHILHHKDRAGYGEQVLIRLAARVGKSERSLDRVLKLYREMPKIPTALSELELTHLYALTTIPDKKLRYEFGKRAVEKKWNTDQLVAKIKKEIHGDLSFNGKSTNGSADYSLIARPKLGTLYTYRLVETLDGQLEIDQGFSIYKTEVNLRSKLKEGEIAESKKAEDGTYSAIKSNRTESDLFTFKAFVERVVDADTLFVKIDLGFGNSTRQYLRLRALDAAEVATEKGRKAKAFVQACVKDVPFVILTSTRSDKFDRYLADLFIPGKEFLKEWQKGTAVLSESSDLLYLNNELLNRRFAVRMK